MTVGRSCLRARQYQRSRSVFEEGDHHKLVQTKRAARTDGSLGAYPLDHNSDRVGEAHWIVRDIT